MNNNIMIFVFSFNRGQFLKNCISSIELTCPNMPVCIVDDDSNDVDTLEILNEIRRKYQVVINRKKDEVEFKTGGLSASMGIAMSMARQRGFDYVLFIQDDMQFVRPWRACDFDYIVDYFDKVENSFQLSNSFVRILSVDTFLDDHYISLETNCYIRKREYERGKSNFSDTGVFSVERFYELFEKFEIGEHINSMKAKERGLVCGRSIYPNMCWLPYPQSYRGGGRSVKHRIFEHFGRSGFYPIDMMSADKEEELFNRNPAIIPVMENFLHSPNAPRHDVWSTGGGEYNFAAYDGYAARLYKAARSLKRSLVRRVG